MAEVALPAAGAADEAPPRPDFEIVPLRGLPIVGAVLIALIAAIAANKLWAWRAISPSTASPRPGDDPLTGSLTRAI